MDTHEREGSLEKFIDDIAARATGDLDGGCPVPKWVMTGAKSEDRAFWVCHAKNQRLITRCRKGGVGGGGTDNDVATLDEGGAAQQVVELINGGRNKVRQRRLTFDLLAFAGAHVVIQADGFDAWVG